MATQKRAFSFSYKEINNIENTVAYLRRWNFWLPRGWSIKLHQILRADDDRCQHTHPWIMVRVILWGGYIEERGPDGRQYWLLPWRPWAPWRIYISRTNFRHRITRLLCSSSWTLALCGPQVLPWGFFTKTGWVPWRQFVHAAENQKVLWCDDGRVLNENLDTQLVSKEQP